MRKRPQYKLSSKPDQLFKCRSEALHAASIACRAHAEPQLLMTIRPGGEVVDWQVISTEQLFDRRNGALVMLIDVSPSVNVGD